MKWWLRYIAARIAGTWERATGQALRNSITLREYIARCELDPARLRAFGESKEG